MCKRSIIIAAVFIILYLMIANASAQAPNTILYQGRLTNAGGAPLQQTDVDSVHFTIYSEDMTALYDTAVTDLTVDMNGVFTIELGPLAASVFGGEKRFLGIKVNADPEMAPPQPITSAPYAYSSNLPPTITSNHTFMGTIAFGDSTMRISNNSIRIGHVDLPPLDNQVHIVRKYNATDAKYGMVCEQYNGNTGAIYGLYSDVFNNGGGSRSGVYSRVMALPDGVSTGSSYGVRAYSWHGEAAYGLWGSASSATNNYGVYGSCEVSDGNYGGYFYGNLHATGSNTKGSGGIKIDHPLEPENKYLVHSDIQSPDMMNIYNGNVTTDDNGYATVALPGYFEALNKDFRYQLTVIDQFAQAIISEKITDNKFIIQTDKPFVEVSWQVTGIRKDVYAETNRIQVEVDKSEDEIGLYMHPEARGYGIEKSIDYKHHKNIPDAEAERNN